MTSDAVIEAGARALFAHDNNVAVWDYMSSGTQDSYRKMARAAYDAMAPLIRAEALLAAAAEIDRLRAIENRPEEDCTDEENAAERRFNVTYEDNVGGWLRARVDAAGDEQ